MKLPCNVIKDLLPLYAENMLSEESKTLVSEHLSECESCSKQKSELSHEIVIADTDAASIKKVRKELRKRWLFGILVAALATATAVCALFGMLTARSYKTFDESKPRVSQSGDMLILEFDGDITGYEIEIEKESGRIEGQRYIIVRISAYSSIWDKWVSGRPHSYVLSATESNVDTVLYCSNDGSDDVLLFGENILDSGTALPRLTLIYYLVIAAMFAAVLLALALVFRKRRKLARGLIIAALLPIAYVIAHILIKGLATATYSLVRDFAVILLTTLPLYGLLTALYLKLAASLKKRSKKNSEI